MLKIACFCLTVAAVTPLWSQVEPSASGGGFTLDDTQMMTPPPLSGDAYPVIVGSEVRSNYLAGGVVVTGAYVDNLMLTNANGPISDESYTILPTISLSRTTPRQGESVGYSSGFTFYQNTSQLNGATQDATANFRFHLSPYAVVVLGDTFRQNYNLYNQANPFAGAGVSPTPGSSNTALIAPFQNQLTNSSSAGINYQYGKNAMIGGTASYSFMNYSQVEDVVGLTNEDTTGANGFFSRRLSRSQYVGVTYQFAKIDTHPIDTYTLTHTIFGFYTMYFTESFSLSVLGGPEHYTSWTPTTAKAGSWTPAVQGSFGWQKPHTSVAATFSHMVSGAGGLIGTYHSDVAGLNARVAVTRTWSAGVHGDYSLFKNVSPGAIESFAEGGHTIDGGVSVQHRITEKMSAEAGYLHLHQNYSGIPTASAFPDSNRVLVSITYQFNRSLGR